MEREFILQPAVKEEVPLFVGLVGPSSSGKTYTALRLATGIHKVMNQPGGIIVIDTENRRALHYCTWSLGRRLDRSTTWPLSGSRRRRTPARL